MTPPRAGATGEIPTNERIAALRSEVLKYEESAARYGTSHSLPFVLDALCGSQHAATRTALLAELAASAGEEIAALVDAFGSFLPRGWRDDPRFIEARTALLAHVGQLVAQRDEARDWFNETLYEVENHPGMTLRLLVHRMNSMAEALGVKPIALPPESPVSAPTSTEREVLEEAAVYVETKADLGAHTASVIARAIRALGPGDAPARASYKSIHYEAGE